MIDWNWALNKGKNESSLPMVINHFIERYSYKSYLEIGLRDGYTFREIRCDNKVSVDIDPQYIADWIMSSDEFFERQHDTYDLIFIDGLHQKKQFKRDLYNSIKILNKGGTIICHDVNPTSEQLLQRRYCYDVWEVFARFRVIQPNLYMCVLPFDYIGIVQRGKQKLYKGELEYTWDYLDKHRKELMNELSEEEFVEKFG